MNKEFPVPQAEAFVGKTEVNPDKIKLGARFTRAEDGQPITDVREILRKVFAYAGEPIQGLELKKTERDLQIIALAMESVKRFARELGKEDFIDLPLQNIHFLKPGGTKKRTGGEAHVGASSPVLGRVLVDRRSDLKTAITTFHELWHTLAEYKAVQVTTKGKIQSLRSGLEVSSRDGEHSWGSYFNEALAGIATTRFVEEGLSQHELFREEFQRRKDEGKLIDTTRMKEAAEAQQIFRLIHEKNNQQYDAIEKVRDVFFRAQVIGSSPEEMERLVNGTFGEGAFDSFVDYNSKDHKKRLTETLPADKPPSHVGRKR